MNINEARIYSFGKLQNQTFQFASGINVVYGENEAGKSTLHEFLAAMLFGMEKGKGRAAATEKYTRYEPWHAPAYYSGALRFSVERRPFYLERNFYYKEKKEILKNEADGEQLSVAYGDLQMLLGGMSREAFENTHNIPQSGAATGKELADILAEYLSDAAESGNAGIRVTRAQNLLHAKRKELNQSLKKEKNEKNQQVQNLLVEKELLERDIHTLLGNIADAEREMNQLKRLQEQEKSQSSRAVEIDEHETNENAGEERLSQKQKKSRRAAMVFVFSLIALFLNGMAYRWFHYPVAAAAAGEAVFAALAAAAALAWRWGEEKYRKEISRQEKQKGEAQKEQMRRAQAAHYGNAALTQAERMLKNLRDSLAEKETRRYNIIEKIEAAQQPNEEEKRLQTDLQAVEFASSEIERLAKECYEDVWDSLNGAVSGWVFRMTGGKYDSVAVTAEGRLQILTEGREVPPETLSRGTLEQIYLALRLAVGEIVTREENIPIFLDETFSMYDDRRLEQALQALAEKREQIFLFTCQHREMDLLEKSGIPYHKVVLGQVE